MSAVQQSLQAERREGEDPVKEGEKAAQVSFETTNLASFVWYSVCIPLASLCSLPEDKQNLEAH